MVPESRGDTTRDVWTIGQAALGPVSLVRGAGGNRASSRAGLLNAGSRSPAGAGSVDLDGIVRNLVRNAVKYAGGCFRKLWRRPRPA